jgi:hypothetical protein
VRRRKEGMKEGKEKRKKEKKGNYTTSLAKVKSELCLERNTIKQYLDLAQSWRALLGKV